MLIANNSQLRHVLQFVLKNEIRICLNDMSANRKTVVGELWLGMLGVQHRIAYCFRFPNAPKPRTIANEANRQRASKTNIVFSSRL